MPGRGWIRRLIVVRSVVPRVIAVRTCYREVRSVCRVAVRGIHADRLPVRAKIAGPVGALGVLALFYYLIYRAVVASRSSQDRLGTYICLLVAAWITGQMAINVGMVLGFLPTIGVPLPFISYGGSALVAVCCGVALILNVRGRRFVNA